MAKKKITVKPDSVKIAKPIVNTTPTKKNTTPPATPAYKAMKKKNIAAKDSIYKEVDKLIKKRKK